MRQLLRPVYIFTLNTYSVDHEQHILLSEGLQDSQFKILQGSYKGETEQSYLVDADFKDTAFKLVREYNQESILFLDENRDAFLLYLDNPENRQFIGRFKAVNDVKGLDAYTIDLSTGQAYTIDLTTGQAYTAIESEV